MAHVPRFRKCNSSAPASSGWPTRGWNYEGYGKRLEERFGPALETFETRHLQARLEAARRRWGLPPISPERLSQVAGHEHR
jgi:hypothetical protein